MSMSDRNSVSVLNPHSWSSFFLAQNFSLENAYLECFREKRVPINRFFGLKIKSETNRFIFLSHFSPYYFLIKLRIYLLAEL